MSRSSTLVAAMLVLLQAASTGQTDDARQDQASEPTGRKIIEQSVQNYKEATARAVESAVREAYQREFAETVPVPAIFNDGRSLDCKGDGHVTTTAYLKKGDYGVALLQMYLSRDGTQVLRRSIAYPRAPAGTFKTLAVILRYTKTVDSSAIKLLEKAQALINDDHAAFARARRYRAPPVVFENTNIFMDPTEIADPRDPADVRAAVQRKGLSPDDYRPFIVIDANPDRAAGGWSRPGGDIYMGNYGRWTTPLGEREWNSVARAVYHHEVAHYWGWDHDWSPRCGETKLGFEPFITAPLLFGWEDIDGDGVPEVIDDTPYGR